MAKLNLKERIGNALKHKELNELSEATEATEAIERVELVEISAEATKMTEMTEMIETTSEAPDFSNLPKEERALKEAEWALREVIAKDGSLDEELHAGEVEKARQAMEEAQAELARIKAEKEARFHEANRRVMEAQANVKLAERQKGVWQEVDGILQSFKATDMGKEIPSETALVLAMYVHAIPPFTRENPQDHQYWAVQTRDYFRSLSEIPSKIADYYAHKKRAGLK